MQKGWQKKAWTVGYWIGDGLSGPHPNTWLKECKIKQFLHVLCSLETDIEWVTDSACYFDSTVQTREYLGRTLVTRENYHKRLADWITRLDQESKQAGGYYIQLTDRTSIERYFNFLQTAKIEST